MSDSLKGSGAFVAVENSAPADGTGAGETADTFDVGSVIDKFAPQLLAKEAAGTPEEPVAQEAATPPADAAPAPEAPPVEAPKESEPPLSAKRLAALARREAELEAAKAKMTDDVAKQVEAARQELVRQFSLNPVRFARQHNLSPQQAAQLADQFYALALGESASPEMKSQLRQMELEADLAEVKQTLKKPEADPVHTAEFRAQVAVTDREIKSFVKAPPTTELPFLAAEAESDPEGTYQALCLIAAPLIQAGEWPSVRDLAKQLDTQLRADYERLDRIAKRTQSASSTQTPPSAIKTPPATLSDADVTPRPSKEPQKLLTDEEYRRRAIATAQRLGGLIRR